MNNVINGGHVMSMLLGILVGGLGVYYYCNLPENDVVKEDLYEELVDSTRKENEALSFSKHVKTMKPLNLSVVRSEYNTITKNYSNNDVEVVSTMRPNCKENTHVISFDDFCMGDDSKEKTTLTYYTQCDTLVDDGEEVVDDRLSLIGNALERFGDMSGDPEIVYVRNEKLGTDFEIVKDNSVYNTDIGGDE